MSNQRGNPLLHGVSEWNVATYRVEPCVIVANLYGVDPPIGRGRWICNSGACDWMYRLIVESLLVQAFPRGNPTAERFNPAQILGLDLSSVSSRTLRSVRRRGVGD